METQQEAEYFMESPWGPAAAALPPLWCRIRRSYMKMSWMIHGVGGSPLHQPLTEAKLGSQQKVRKEPRGLLGLFTLATEAERIGLDATIRAIHLPAGAAQTADWNRSEIRERNEHKLNTTSSSIFVFAPLQINWRFSPISSPTLLPTDACGPPRGGDAMLAEALRR